MLICFAQSIVLGDNWWMVSITKRTSQTFSNFGSYWSTPDMSIGLREASQIIQFEDIACEMSLLAQSLFGRDGVCICTN